jgi:transcriptional regulator with XRE-family HTH domain
LSAVVGGSRKTKVVTRRTVDAAELYRTLGARIAELRKQREISQADLSFMVGLTRTSITNVEAGRQRINVATLYDIALALKVKPSRLIVWDEP